MHEQKEDKSHGKSPAPELRIDPDHQQHGSTGLQQDRQELQERQKNKLQFREKLRDQDPHHGNGAERFFDTTPGCLSLRWLELRFFGLKIHCFATLNR